MPVVRITQDFINNGLVCNTGRRIEYVSDDRSGFYIEVRSSSQGEGTYYLRYKGIEGKTRHQHIGKTTDMTLAAAKQAARELKASINAGSDPRAEEQARLSVLTFDGFFYQHYMPYATPRKRSISRDEQLFRIRIKPKFGALRLNQLTRQEIQSFHTELLAEGMAEASANHHLKLIRRCLNLAVEWEMLDKSPATRIPLFTEINQVEHYLEKDELQRLLAVLHNHPNRTVSMIVLFLLSTGARLNEALKAKWMQIDRANRVWRIPASNSKSKRIRAVPLNDSALSVLEQLETENEFEFLFINLKTRLPYTTIHKTFQKITAAAGIHGKFRCHDARHQFASFLVNSGRSLYEVQQILGHSDPSVTTRYAHLSTKTLQDAASTASFMIDGAMPTKLQEVQSL